VTPGSPATPIAQLRQAVARSGANSQLVTIEGVVTLGKGGFVPGRNQFNLQDDSGGIVIDDQPRLAGIMPQMGEVVRITGRLAEYSGMLQLSPTGPAVRLGQIAMPPARIVVPGQFSESLEGMLLEVRGVRMTEGTFPRVPGNMNLGMRAADGTPLKVFIDEDTGISGSTPLQAFTIRGILYSFNNQWVLYPRGPQDIEL
jgi:predicted extracellular nuclease